MNPDYIWFAAVAVVGYLVGSISFAVLIARSRGVDIFTEGSGNPGATNVKRVLGKTAGNICFLLDLLKGAVAAGWPLLPFIYTGAYAVEMAITGLVFAIIGHSFSIFIRFRGGKGVATTMGGLLVIMPLVFIIGALCWIVVFYSFRYVSLASLAFGISLPISALLLGISTAEIVLCALLAILIILRHKSNIQRLLKGEENRFVKQKK